MNNNNISVSNNQAFLKESFNIAYSLGGSTPAMFVPERVSGYTPLRLKMINFVIRSINIHKDSFVAQSTIAKSVGCNREAVNVAFKFFVEQGLFTVESGKKKRRTNKYFLGPVLLDSKIRWALRYVSTGLTRAYHKIVSQLNKTVESAVVEPKRTVLYKINVLDKNNTSVCSYRKRRDCEGVCFKQHKEDRLYSKPYMGKNAWLNMQKNMWADWSLTQEDYLQGIHMNIYQLDQDLLFDSDTQESIRKDRKYQQFKRNDAKYPDLYRDLKAFHEPELKKPVIVKPVETKIYSVVMHQRLDLCSKEDNLSRRVLMLERLRGQVERASIPYIDFLLRKTKSNMNV